MWFSAELSQNSVSLKLNWSTSLDFRFFLPKCSLNTVFEKILASRQDSGTLKNELSGTYWELKFEAVLHEKSNTYSANV